MSHPFAAAAIGPGEGVVHLALLPPDTPRLRTLSYKYPLKLVSPAAQQNTSEPRRLVFAIYLLTYGGGLVAGDAIDLRVVVEETLRITFLTQGSTKLFKAPSPDVVSTQRLTVDLHRGSALCYLPDPVQPFEGSRFEQHQIFNLHQPGPEAPHQSPSLCFLDWVSNGRSANGEDWSLSRYGSKNELYLQFRDQTRKLLLRDNLFLDSESSDGIASRMDGLAIFATLVLYGPVFGRLAQFFQNEFRALPRIGCPKWDSGSESGGEPEEPDPAMARRAQRQRQETADRVLWTAASARDCVVVKFGAREVEGGRRWLGSMLDEEGSIEREFGERALLCLR